MFAININQRDLGSATTKQDSETLASGMLEAVPTTMPPVCFSPVLAPRNRGLNLSKKKVEVDEVLCPTYRCKLYSSIGSLLLLDVARGSAGRDKPRFGLPGLEFQRFTRRLRGVILSMSTLAARRRRCLTCWSRPPRHTLPMAAFGWGFLFWSSCAGYQQQYLQPPVLVRGKPKVLGSCLGDILTKRIRRDAWEFAYTWQCPISRPFPSIPELHEMGGP